MPFYAGRGKLSHEVRFDETIVRLWSVLVGEERRSIYRGTEQQVMEAVSDDFYGEDWSILPYKFLALKSEIIDVSERTQE
jgi:hypothetical protein